MLRQAPAKCLWWDLGDLSDGAGAGQRFVQGKELAKPVLKNELVLS